MQDENIKRDGKTWKITESRPVGVKVRSQCDRPASGKQRHNQGVQTDSATIIDVKGKEKWPQVRPNMLINSRSIQAVAINWITSQGRPNVKLFLKNFHFVRDFQLQ